MFRKGKRVFCYYNKKNKVYCVNDVESKKLIAQSDYVSLRDVKFNILGEDEHEAVIEGELVGLYPIKGCYKPVGYNPYTHSTFFTVDEREPVLEAPYTELHSGLAWLEDPQEKEGRRAVAG